MTSRYTQPLLLAAGLCAAVGLTGCDPEQLAEAGLVDPAETSEIGETEQAIINGNAVRRGSLAWRGIVRVNGGCTGTMLSNRFVLTARHCVRTWANGAWGAAAATVNVTLEGRTAADDQVVSAARVLEPNTNTVNAGDYALIELSSPLEVNGSTTNFVNLIYDGDDDDLEGRQVFCAGYGNGTEAVAATNTFGGNGGVLRSATLTVTDTGGNTLTLGRNGNNQIGSPGDSGSTCFWNGRVLGVQSTCWGDWSDISGDGNFQSREWTRIRTCTAASPNAYRAWAEARIHADVNLSYPTVPPIGGAVRVQLRAANDSDDIWVWGGLSYGTFALRGAWLNARVDTPPAGYVCSRAHATTPVRGDATLNGACLSDALAASVSM